MTKREMFNMILSLNEVQENSALMEAVKHEIALLDKKANAERKPTQNQIQNETYKEAIVSYMSAINAPRSVKEMMSEIESLHGLSTPKVSALVTALYDKGNGILSRETIKKVNYYKIVI